MLKRSQYPKKLLIGDEIYHVRFVRRFKDPHTLGECDPSEKEIRIKQGMSQKETFKTFLHELMHAIFEFEGGVTIPHALIGRLEEPLYNFIISNML